MAFPATFADLTQTVIDLVRLDTTLDTSRVQDAINTSYFEAVVENEVLVSSGSALLTANVGTYDLDTVTQIARIKDLWTAQSDVRSVPLRQVSLDRILRARQTNSGLAVAEPGVLSWYALSGQNQLDVWPTPQAADTLHFVYAGFPAVLSGTDVPGIPEPYSSNLLTYGAAVPMAEFKGDMLALGGFQQQAAVWQAKFRMHLNLRRGQPGGFEFATDRSYPPHDRATITPWT